jgi:acetyl esterase/lipase
MKPGMSRFALALLIVSDATVAAQQRQLAFTLPGMAQVRRLADLGYRSVIGADTVMYGIDLRYDVYLPAGGGAGTRPGVVFVHGGMVAGGTSRISPKDDLPSYQQWGRLVAAAGLVGITFSHRLTTNENIDVAAEDVEELMRAVRARAREWGLDPNRMCVAFFSAGGPLSSLFLQRRSDPVRCVVLFYPFLDLDHSAVNTQFRRAHTPERVAQLERFSPRAQLLVHGSAVPPILLARAGRDAIPGINASIDRFMQAALWVNAPLDFYLHPTGAHGFDMTAVPDPRAEQILSATVDFIRRHTR